MKNKKKNLSGKVKTAQWGERRISELEDGLCKLLNSNSEEQSRLKKKKEHNLKVMWDYNRRPHIHGTKRIKKNRK